MRWRTTPRGLCHRSPRRREVFSRHIGKCDIVYADPPWSYYGDAHKMGAAGKHYALMSDEDLAKLPVKELLRDPQRGAFFVWATCPKLDLAIRTIDAWGLHYRGV
ncbi:MAG: MT-A70 family methyltransferase, partial [Ilumatobacteraceae bacterium]